MNEKNKKKTRKVSAQKEGAKVGEGAFLDITLDRSPMENLHDVHDACRFCVCRPRCNVPTLILDDQSWKMFLELTPSGI